MCLPVSDYVDSVRPGPDVVLILELAEFQTSVPGAPDGPKSPCKTQKGGQVPEVIVQMLLVMASFFHSTIKKYTDTFGRLSQLAQLYFVSLVTLISRSSDWSRLPLQTQMKQYSHTEKLSCVIDGWMIE